MDNKQAVYILQTYLENNPDDAVVGVTGVNDVCPLACALKQATGRLWHVSYYGAWEDAYTIPEDDDINPASRNTEETFAYQFETDVLYHFVRLVDKTHDHSDITAKEAKAALEEAFQLCAERR